MSKMVEMMDQWFSKKHGLSPLGEEVAGLPVEVSAKEEGGYCPPLEGGVPDIEPELTKSAVEKLNYYQYAINQKLAREAERDLMIFLHADNKLEKERISQSKTYQSEYKIIQ